MGELPPALVLPREGRRDAGAALLGRPKEPLPLEGEGSGGGERNL